MRILKYHKATKSHLVTSTRIFLLSVGLVAFQLSACTIVGADSDGAHRFINNGVLVSLHEPSLAISVDVSFSFLGRHPIAIGNTGAGERFIFVDDEEKNIRRLFIVQFEGFLPGVDDEFRYDLSDRPVVANYPFRSNGYAFDLAEAVASNPTSESASTKAFLDTNGYSTPNELMMWRSLTIVDSERKKEVIIFYLENVESTELRLSDLYHDDLATPAWINIQRDLEMRANKSFRLAELDESGMPLSSTWSSIPNTFMQ